jgi:hypothetical protein
MILQCRFKLPTPDDQIVPAIAHKQATRQFEKCLAHSKTRQTNAQNMTPVNLQLRDTQHTVHA